MAKTISNRAIALFETASLEEVPVRQAVIRDYAAGAHLEIVNFFTVQGSITIGIEEALRMAIDKNVGNIIVDSAQTLRLVPEALINVIDRLLNLDLCLHIADQAARFEHHHLTSLKHIMNASKEAGWSVRSTRIKQGLTRKHKQKNARRFGGNVDEGVVIARILELHAEGMSLQKIGETLVHSDIKTVHNKKWHPTTIKRIIERAKRKQ